MCCEFYMTNFVAIMIIYVKSNNNLKHISGLTLGYSSTVRGCMLSTSQRTDSYLSYPHLSSHHTGLVLSTASDLWCTNMRCNRQHKTACIAKRKAYPASTLRSAIADWRIITQQHFFNFILNTSFQRYSLNFVKQTFLEPKFPLI